MAIVKSILVGLIASLLAVVAVVLAQVLIFMATIAWQRRAGAGVGAATFSVMVPSLQTVAAAVVGFALGFWWMWRRSPARR
jgi:uncharacterized BrkB/YihY/UPF0761 family membrane protein